jgi:Mitochondrial morphogenesis regulator
LNFQEIENFHPNLFFLCSELKSPTVHLIREIYDGENAHENFIQDLDRALNERYDYIIVEPAKVADETAMWILVGNCLHKTGVVTGLASIASGLLSNFFLSKHKHSTSCIFRLHLAPQHHNLLFFWLRVTLLHITLHNQLGHRPLRKISNRKKSKETAEISEPPRLFIARHTEVQKQFEKQILTSTCNGCCCRCCWLPYLRDAEVAFG